MFLTPPGQEGYEHLRTLSYPGTDIYLLAYSCADSDTLHNIESKWHEELVAWAEEHHDEDDDPWVCLLYTSPSPRDS